MTWQNRRYCGEVTNEKIGEKIQLSGWVDAVRDHGHLLFIHLRDVTGIVQIVCHPDQSCYDTVRQLRTEFVITVTGTLAKRSTETINPNLSTGELEVIVTDLHLDNASITPPFEISEKEMVADGDADAEFKVDEDIRLTYRYLDLRRPSMQKNFIKRYHILKFIRDFLHTNRFIEVETPILTKSTPEGARDYLVPSRVHPTAFYALPQSPQLFKQLLMVSGFDRYFQIAKCFRDEDLRPNRQPEFTQVDLEASFIDEDFIMQLIEKLLISLFHEHKIELQSPFPVITYQESMSRYGNDRPDLRFDWPLVEISDLLANTQYQIFNRILSGGGIIKGINLTGQADKLSKNILQEELAKGLIPKLGAKGMTWMKVENGLLDSNIVQFFSEDEQRALISRMTAKDGDVLIFIADTNHQLVHNVLGQFRLIMAKRLGIIDETKFAPCWVIDFPLFEQADGGLTSVHHPFTQPQVSLDGLDQAALLTVKARAYDVVINGEELGGGSIRIHNPKQQEQIFNALGMSPKQITDNFGFFVQALNYGAPPHGGLALGVDRLVGMLIGVDSIRDVMAFPKNRMAYCPLTASPSPVSAAQLVELNLRVTDPESMA